MVEDEEALQRLLAAAERGSTGEVSAQGEEEVLDQRQQRGQASETLNTQTTAPGPATGDSQFDIEMVDDSTMSDVGKYLSF